MKKVKILTITLVIILITAVAFLGIYMQKQNRMENTVKDYVYGMDLKGTRNIRLKLDEGTTTLIKDSEGKEVEDSDNLTDEQIAEKGYTKEEKANNSEEVKNVENYKKSKEIIEERLKKMQIESYIIKLDEQTGEIVVEIPENQSTDAVVSQLSTVGKFEILDSETKEVLMNNTDIKQVNVMYGADSASTTSTQRGTRVYLSIEFTKDGARKLEDISTKYVKVEEPKTDENSANEGDTATNSENTTNDGQAETTTEKKVTIKLDETEIMTTSFEEPMKTGTMQLSMGGVSTDTKTLQGYASQASSVAILLDSGNLPIKYEITENSFVLSDITSQELDIVIYVMLAVVVISLIVLIIRYKRQGAIATISYIGLISLLLLVIRYTNVEMTIEGIFGIAVVLFLNYVFVNKLLSKLKNEELDKKIINEKIVETYKEFFIKIVPVCILAITFCFINWASISSFGMVMFWGITLIAVYNAIFTNNLFKIEADK